jgi:hypothetical protein
VRLVAVLPELLAVIVPDHHEGVVQPAGLVEQGLDRLEARVQPPDLAVVQHAQVRLEQLLLGGGERRVGVAPGVVDVAGGADRKH